MKFRFYLSKDRNCLVETINTVCAEGRWMRTERFEPTPAWEHALNEPQCPIPSAPAGLRRRTPHRMVSALSSRCARHSRSRDRFTRALPRSGPGYHSGASRLGWAREAELHRIRLRTHENKNRAHRVFAHCGFRTVGVSDNWVKMAYQIDDMAAQGESTCD
jgi:hypothetical protein